MALTIKGVYKDGHVELLERPVGVCDATEVVVMFPTVERAEKPVTTEPAHDAVRREAGRRLLARLKAGIPFGGSPYPKREELYDRPYRFDKTRDG